MSSISQTANPEDARESSTNKNCSKKRRRRSHHQQERLNAEDQLEAERRDRFDKLLYQAKKALHKEAKVVKSFEVQKVVRLIKEGGNHNQSTPKLLEEKLAMVKQFPVDTVVEICIKRLGIRNLSPYPDEIKFESNTEGDGIVEKMLQHKRLGAVMEIWNEKVTEYRRWYLKRKDAVEGVPDFVQEMQPTHLKKKKQESVPSMFVSLGGVHQDGMDDNDGDPDEYGAYGPAHGLEMEMKRNRPGQRQRQAKAKALQAKKEGRTVEKSLNWREKKKKAENEDATSASRRAPSKDVKPEKIDASKIATMGKTWKEEGATHPSWAARASLKTGIVAFTGKKITFD